jgi:hypothetical protein
MRVNSLRNLGAWLTFGGVVGCTPPGPNLKTPIPEQYTLPPVDDARFSNPPSYPKDTLNQDTPKLTSKDKDAPKMPSQMPQMGGGPGGGMGRPGGGF